MHTLNFHPSLPLEQAVALGLVLACQSDGQLLFGGHHHQLQHHCKWLCLLIQLLKRVILLFSHCFMHGTLGCPSQTNLQVFELLNGLRLFGTRNSREAKMIFQTTVAENVSGACGKSQAWQLALELFETAQERGDVSSILLGSKISKKSLGQSKYITY